MQRNPLDQDAKEIERAILEIDAWAKRKPSGSVVTSAEPLCNFYINNIFSNNFSPTRESFDVMYQFFLIDTKKNKSKHEKRVDVFVLDPEMDEAEILKELSDDSPYYVDPYTKYKFIMVTHQSIPYLPDMHYKIKVRKLASVCKMFELDQAKALLANAGPSLCIDIADECLIDKKYDLAILAFELALERFETASADNASSEIHRMHASTSSRLTHIRSMKENMDSKHFMDRGWECYNQGDYQNAIVYFVQARYRARDVRHKFLAEHYCDMQLRAAAYRGEFADLLNYYEPASLEDFRSYEKQGVIMCYYTDRIRHLYLSLNSTDRVLLLAKLSAEHCRIIGEDCVSDARNIELSKKTCLSKTEAEMIQHFQVSFKPQYKEAIVYYTAKIEKELAMQKKDEVLLAHSFLLCADAYAKLNQLEHALSFYCLALHCIPGIPASGDLAEFILATSKRAIFNVIMKFEDIHRILILNECVNPASILGRAMLDDAPQVQKRFIFFSTLQSVENFQASIIADLAKMKDKESKTNALAEEAFYAAFNDFRASGCRVESTDEDGQELQSFSAASIRRVDAEDDVRDDVEYGYRADDAHVSTGLSSNHVSAAAAAAAPAASLALPVSRTPVSAAAGAVRSQDPETPPDMVSAHLIL